MWYVAHCSPVAAWPRTGDKLLASVSLPSSALPGHLTRCQKDTPLPSHERKIWGDLLDGAQFLSFHRSELLFALFPAPSSDALPSLDFAVVSVRWISKPTFTEGGMVLTPLNQPASGPALFGPRKSLSLSTA